MVRLPPLAGRCLRLYAGQDRLPQRRRVEPLAADRYQKSFSPAWFGQGITYQIFPDRFCRLEVPSPEGLVGERWVHQDWAEAPAWRPEADGEVRNRDFFGGSLQGIVSSSPI